MKKIRPTRPGLAWLINWAGKSLACLNPVRIGPIIDELSLGMPRPVPARPMSTPIGKSVTWFQG